MPEAASPDSETAGPRVPAAAWRRRWQRLPRPAPFELFSYGGVVATIWFLNQNGLRFGWNSIEYVLLAARWPALLALVVGVAAQLAARGLRRQAMRDYLAQVFTFDWLALWCRLWLVAVAFVYTVTWLKISVPLVRTVLFDPPLWRLDRLLHFGVSPSILAVELTAGTPLPALLDVWYALWVPSIPLAWAYFTAGTGNERRRNFILANSLIWTLGGWIYMASPALGPCYASPELFEPIRAQMPLAVGTQQTLWAQYAKLLESRGHVLASFSPLLGIGAMPSLHVAAHWLLALWAKRYERRLFLPLALATGLTFFGSLVTGWHYAVDGYVGLLLAWLAVLVADWWQPAPKGATTFCGRRRFAGRGRTVARVSGRASIPA